MRKLIVVLIPIIFIAIGVLIGGFFWWREAQLAPGTDTAQKRFVITKGASSDTIGANLEEAGIIRDAFAFKLYLQFNNLVTQVPPGEFRISQNLTLQEVVETLLEGPVEFWVTIPEGFRREQIPNQFIKALELSGSEAEAFHQEFLATSRDMEGYLYPDTYLFAPDTTATAVVTRLRETFDQKFSPTVTELAETGLSLDEVVILASIIERETLSAAERPEVAGVYFNRLQEGWPLQADATVQYALGTQRCGEEIDCEWWETPTSADLENTQSPYNTYQFVGLPPSPIANPGIISLEAVVNAVETDYWYYVHDADGGVHFARDLDEHNQNIERYLR
ncbi:hypothetical protein A2801_00690 [Candidatus Woesebacteria bacterium RIFCSPHIGHO2_01_FULL_41_10]|uniref:Endolytic murein transglycosylase n=1 Tax=Candidatus Woesebacteria bacterium RIFCSPHIGHO2_01_FULL_41_10 TaxID=1802500 RepID=A0A1F7YMS5_9BACT|nr:MAG: hypothetical protein A2801_00690 [Candidatus Woesebacteria bacterium RIFCSPHIGHO2_01_FULL_41_10]